jgi:hypothetical protein
VIEEQPDASSSRGTPGRRIAWASVVGIILPVALLAWAALMTRIFLDSPPCGGCLGYLVQAWEVGRWIAIVLAWPLLHSYEYGSPGPWQSWPLSS